MQTIGIDEVGRGCWAGPVVAGAVMLLEPIEHLTDSKKLSKEQRSSLAAIIEQRAVAIGLGWVSASMIDKIGLTAAIRLAMQKALQQIPAAYDEIIVDGNFNYLAKNPKSQAVIKADDSVPAVSAASIIAKVARDKYMSELGKKYAMYEFGRHAGYGTPMHTERLKLHGASDLHRRSFKPIKFL